MLAARVSPRSLCLSHSSLNNQIGRNCLFSRGMILASSRRDYPRVRTSKEKEIQTHVRIRLEDNLPDDPEILNISEMLRLNVPIAMKLALDGLKGSQCKTRDASISNAGCFESVELSVLLCNDEFIRKLNNDLRDEDRPTDVLSMSQHDPELQAPILVLGEIVISVETVARQAEERGHDILDEIRMLVVLGLLHLLGYREISEEAEAEMEKEEEILLESLGWTRKGKGLIQSVYDAESNGISPHIDGVHDRKKEGSLRFYKPKFQYIFCDMDGTLLNSKSQISLSTAKALKEATSRGVKVVIATGKTRQAAMNILKMVDLVGKDGIMSESAPGVFSQGLLVYGREGQEIFRSNLDPAVCKEALLYSLKHEVPLVASSGERYLTLSHHPLVDSLHTIYHEPQAEIIPSVEQLLAVGDIQTLMFLDTAEGVATTLRPYWAEATGDNASVVQSIPHILEIVPSGTSKGNGVRMLLDHLSVSPKEIMAIGDGENDVEMLELAGLGIALSNGADETKAVADVIGASNDEDGVADAIYRYAF